MVGIDDGSDSAVAQQWAAREAAMTHRPLTMVYAQFDPYSVIPADAAIPPAVEFGVQPADADRMLADAVEAVRRFEPGVEIITYTEPANPARLLLEQAKDAALVVLGNRGASVLSELVLGTVCGAVAAKAPCPVIAVSGQPAWPDAPIVVGVDGSMISAQAVEFAFDLAARRGVPLHLHRVLRPGAPDATAEVEERVVPYVARYPGVTLRTACTRGEPVAALIQAAANAQLLVVGARGHGVTAGLLTGSVSHALLRKAPCSMAVVRRGCALATAS
ncbi:MAG: universal stress protein [Sciscionella sp.]